MDLQTQFILQNAHFALDIFAAFVFFAAFWLFFDGWTTERQKKNMWKFIGFLLLSLSFVTASTEVQQTSLSSQFALSSLFATLTTLFRVSGYVCLILGLLMDPLQEKPVYAKGPLIGAPAVIGFGQGILNFLFFDFFLLAGTVGFLFYRRATTGLERHLRLVAIAFFVIAISEFLCIGHLFRGSTNVGIHGFVGLFGPLWIVEQLVLLAGTVLLAKWVFTYLVKRIQTQLFMIFTVVIISIFLITTMAFTMLLLQNLRNDALTHLQTDVNVLNFALESKKAETLSDAQLLAQNPSVEQAVGNKDRITLKSIVSSVLLTKKQGSVVIATATGEVIARGEDPDRLGDSVSSDPLFVRALLGGDVSSAVIKNGVLAPSVSIVSSTPIRSNNQIVGVVIVGSPIDNAFVDGVKNATSLDTSDYAGNIRAATTFLTQYGNSRLIGLKEENPQVQTTVLDTGASYTGGISLLNIPYFAAFLPLKDMKNTPVGILFVGSLQPSVLQAAGRGIQLTFIVTVLLLVLSIVPAYLVSRSISYQLK